MLMFARVVLLLLLALPAWAQTRPTLSEAESRIGVLEAEKVRTRDAICASADVHGETYRPFVCEPRCDCSPTGVALSFAYTSCSETSSGEFTVGFEVDLGACNAFGCNTNSPYGTVCAASSLDSCGAGSPACPAGESCLDPLGIGGVCVVVCSSDAECPTDGLCEYISGASCNTDADCPNGESCLADPVSGNLACGALCGSTVDCQGIARTATLSGVGPVDSTAPVSCNPPLPNISINANDALECLAQYGGGIGGPCTSICGNGIVGPGEGCDDGNTTPGDGCDASCQLES